MFEVSGSKDRCRNTGDVDVTLHERAEDECGDHKVGNKASNIICPRNIILEAQIRMKLRNTELLPRRKNYFDRTDMKQLKTGSVKEIAEHIRNGRIILGYQRHFIQIMGYLMVFKDITYMQDLVSELGFIHLRDEIHVLFNLVYFLINNTDRILNAEEIAYISGQSIDVLRDIFPYGRYPNINLDREGILTAIATGHTMPQRLSITNPDRYMEVIKYPPIGVWEFADVSVEYGVPTGLISPYEMVASMEKTFIEDIFMSTNDDNVDELINIYEIVIPRGMTDSYNKLHGFLMQIYDYGDVFKRTCKTPPPPIIDDDDYVKILTQYTTRELIETYEYSGHWQKRSDLIHHIIRDAETGPIWSWRNKYCKNNSSNNQIDKEDPILSYGIQRNYRCYHVTELINVLNKYPDEFVVPNVNFNLDNGIDPTTRLPYSDRFPLKTMIQLTAVLEHGSAVPHVIELKRILNDRLEKLYSTL